MATGTRTYQVFEGIEKEDVQADRMPKLEAGDYPELEVLSTTRQKSNDVKRKGEEYAVATVKVLAAGEGSTTPVGSVVRLQLSNRSPTFLKDVKSLIASMWKMTPEKAAGIKDENARLVFDPAPEAQQKVKGKTFGARVVPKTSKSTGFPYRVHYFRPTENKA